MQDADPPRAAATYYASHFQHHPMRRGVWEAITGYLQRWIPGESEILELGAGYGYFINHVRGRRRCAVDASPGLQGWLGPGVEGFVRDCSDLSCFGARAFDVVFASNTLEHLDRARLDRLMGELLRVLRPTGRLIVLQPNFRYAFRYYFDDYTHVSVFSHVSLCAYLRSAGFEIEWLARRFLPYSHELLPIRVPSWLVALYLRLPFRPWAHQMLIVARPVGGSAGTSPAARPAQRSAA